MSLWRRSLVAMKTIHCTLKRFLTARDATAAGDTAVIGTVIVASLALAFLSL